MALLTTKGRTFEVSVVISNKPGVREPEGETILHDLVAKSGFEQVELHPRRKISPRDGRRRLTPSPRSGSSRRCATSFESSTPPPTLAKCPSGESQADEGRCHPFPRQQLRPRHDGRAQDRSRGSSRTLVWHEDSSLAKGDYGAIILPGGFSFADRLRAGAIAANSPAMSRVKRLAERGTRCSGCATAFRSSSRAGCFLAPCCATRRSSSSASGRTSASRTRARPSPRGSGRARCSPCPSRTAREGSIFSPQSSRVSRRRAWSTFRYCDAAGRSTAGSNPTGTLHNIAGVSATKRGTSSA